MMTYLLALTVGPVQSNIQESRKLKDLYNSSCIISDIMMEVRSYLKNEVDSEMEVIYPILYDDNDKKRDSSNYIICKINSIDKLNEIQNEVYTKVVENCDGGEQCTFKISVLEETYFIFWAAEPIIETYEEAYKKVTKKLRNIKNTHDFKNVEQDSTKNYSLKKCSLCGKREPLKTYSEINTEEKLCGVCAFKRLYKAGNAESTYSVSIKSWKEKYGKELEELNKKIMDTFKYPDKYYSKDMIKNILNEKRDMDEMRRKKGINEDLQKDIKNSELKQALTQIEEKMRETYSSYSDKNLVLDPHYKYCFLQIDVDDLGKWMSGEYNLNQHELEEVQKQISKYLSEFACKLRESFWNTKCTVIYAGGDDFLAILPVEELFIVIKIIDDIYKNTIVKNINNSPNYSQAMTYSTSITIASCKEEMAVALRKSREELENVKSRFDSKKNGVVINYLINSSKTITTYLSKYIFQQFIESLNDLYEVKDYISFSYINAFEDEFNMLGFDKLNSEQIEDIKEMMLIELKRLLKRSFLKDAEDKLLLNEYYSMHIGLFKEIYNQNSNDNMLDFENMTNAYKIYEKLAEFDYNKEGGYNYEFIKD